MQHLILASGSPYRAAQLRSLNLPFRAFSPDIDETPLPGEAPEKLAGRLAREKAMTLPPDDIVSTRPSTASNHEGKVELPEYSLIMGSDQVASVDDRLLGKPGDRDRAFAQLSTMSGKTVRFYTALCLHNLDSDQQFTAVDLTEVTVRSLNADEIHRYLDADKPFDCAGSFKVESLGITLFESIRSKDPSALVGLPLIAVCKGLRQFGWQLP